MQTSLPTAIAFQLEKAAVSNGFDQIDDNR